MIGSLTGERTIIAGTGKEKGRSQKSKVRDQSAAALARAQVLLLFTFDFSLLTFFQLALDAGLRGGSVSARSTIGSSVELVVIEIGHVERE